MTSATKPNKPKIYGIFLLIFLLGNFALETLLTVIESQFPVSLYGIFPFTRVALLIATVMFTVKYIRKHSGHEVKRRKPFLKVARLITLVVIAVGLVVGILANIRGVAPTAAKESQAAQEYLEANKDRYVACYNSLQTGMVLIGGVSSSYMTYENRGRIGAVEDAYKKKITDECTKPVKDYETTNVSYKSASADTARASLSVLDRIRGTQPKKTDEFSGYDSGYLILTNGGFDKMTFSETEVKQFFQESLH